MEITKVVQKLGRVIKKERKIKKHGYKSRKH